jgi:hypothetical protein
MPKRPYAIALSFPSEHQRFVRNVAEHLALTLGRDRIFFYNWPEHDHKIPGADAPSRLDLIYREQSDLVVPFFSEHYKKPWCSIEWRSIREIFKERRKENAVVPIHLDLTRVPGWRITDVGIRRNSHSGKSIAEKVLRIYQARFAGDERATIPISSIASQSKIAPLLNQLASEIHHGKLQNSYVAPIVLEQLQQAMQLTLASEYQPRWWIDGIQLSDEHLTTFSQNAGDHDWQKAFRIIASPMLVGVALSLERSLAAQAVTIRLFSKFADSLGLRVIWPIDSQAHNDLADAIYRAAKESPDLDCDDVFFETEHLQIRGPS